MMATVTRVRHWQVLLSVVLVMALLVFTFVWDMAFGAFLLEGETMPLDQPEFWIAHLCGLTFYIPAVLLLLFIAAGQITFASENRSTPIRVLLLVPHLLLVGWFVYFWHLAGHEGVLYAMIIIAGIYWTIAGAILTGETAELSPRALRRLPQSFLGRMLFTWLNPGSATGYVFAVLNLATVVFVAFIVPASGPLPNTQFTGGFFRPLPSVGTWLCVGGCLLGYVAGYLGTTHLLVVFARRFTHVGMPATFLAHLVLIGSGVLAPLLIQRAMTGWHYANFSYTTLQIPNWAWTFGELLRFGATGNGTLAASVVIPVGGLVFLANFVLAARAVEHVRQSAPARVQEDDLALHPTPHKKLNPWDDAPASS
jgi:hypothetical protein